jgi:tetratricopeptide (TPR) repeat protein
MAFYRLSLRLLPDGQARLVAVINVGATYLRQGAPEKAIEMLGNAKAEVLQKMGPKAAAGCSYNLGMAYRRCGKYPEALRLFHEVEEIHPVSEYAALAARAIKATRDDAGMTVRPADGD